MQIYCKKKQKTSLMTQGGIHTEYQLLIHETAFCGTVPTPLCMEEQHLQTPKICLPVCQATFHTSYPL